MTLVLQVLEKNGGDDGTRTRGLCRDRNAVTRNQLKLRDTGGSQGTFQNAEKELLDHNWTIISAVLCKPIVAAFINSRAESWRSMSGLPTCNPYCPRLVER